MSCAHALSKLPIKKDTRRSELLSFDHLSSDFNWASSEIESHYSNTSLVTRCYSMVPDGKLNLSRYDGRKNRRRN